MQQIISMFGIRISRFSLLLCIVFFIGAESNGLTSTQQVDQSRISKQSKEFQEVRKELVLLQEGNSKITEQVIKVQSELLATKFELKATKSALTELIVTLMNHKDDSDDTESSGDDLVRKKRAFSDESDADLSHLSINSLLGLRCKDGSDGKEGKDGRDGRDGKDGAPGKDTVSGEKGAPGGRGATGEKGNSGSKGEIGSNGNQGQSGPVGRAGSPGRNGVDGQTGVKGEPGTPGRQGESGTNGRAGSPGLHGRDGRDGPAGSLGEKGAPGTPLANIGSVYTRWGRTVCGNQSTILYSGFTAGSSETQKGGGVNYQCMPPTSEYNTYSTSGDYSSLAGAEYHSSSIGLFPSVVHDDHVPCARCYASSRPAVMMLPGRRTCPLGWTREYEGYLMTGRSTATHQYTFECVDAQPEYIAGSSSSHGALFVFVKPICSGTGSIGHCTSSNYINNRQLTCAVCSK